MREVPEGWVRVRMEDVVRINPPKITPDYEDRTPLVFVPMARVAEEFSGIDVTERRRFAAIKRGYTQFQPGDVLFAKITPCMENGKIAIVPKIRPPLGYGSTEFFVMRPRTDGIGPWIGYCVARSRFRELARKSMQGAVGQLRVPKVWLEDVSIPLAPIPEQHRIVAKVEELFARLDEGIAALRRAEANLERYRTSFLKAAVEGTLTQPWRKENPPEESGNELLRRILAERRTHWEEEQLAKFASNGRKPPRNWKSKYREPVAPETHGLPGLPESWCWTTVDQVTAGNRTSAYGVLKPGPEVPGGIPLVRVGNIQNGMVSGPLKRIAPKIASRYGRTRLRGGELLITLVGAIGRTAVVPSELSGANTARAVAVVPISSMLDPQWIELWFRSPVQRHRMIGKAHEVARKTLNLEDVRNATVALPPASEQGALLLAVEKAKQGLTPTAEDIKESVNFSEALRQSILKRAFEGRLVPQDPNEEPASALLERIRAQREAARRTRKRRPAKPKGNRRSRVP